MHTDFGHPSDRYFKKQRRPLGVFLGDGRSFPGASRRLDDAGDIFTATAEARAVGFKAQMGPWGGIGVYGSDSDAFGVGFIGGQLTSYDFTDVTLPPFLGFVQKFRNFDDDRRRKEFHVVQSWGVPSLRPQANPSGFSGGFKEAGDWRRVAPRYTQVEIAIGFWGGIRLGMNIGEFMDFIIGWTTLRGAPLQFLPRVTFPQPDSAFSISRLSSCCSPCAPLNRGSIQSA